MLIFIHNGKTGGSTLRSYFAESCKVFEAHGFQQDIDFDDLFRSDVLSLHETNFSLNNNILSYMKESNNGMDAEIIATFRNPINLFCSYWNYSISTNAFNSLPHLPVNIVPFTGGNNWNLFETYFDAENPITADEFLELMFRNNFLDDLNEAVLKGYHHEIQSLNIYRYLTQKNIQMTKISGYLKGCSKISFEDVNIIPCETLFCSLIDLLRAKPHLSKYFNEDVRIALTDDSLLSKFSKKIVGKTVIKDPKMASKIKPKNIQHYLIRNAEDYIAWYKNIQRAKFYLPKI